MVDEVGIEIGLYGDYRLKSAYQPIFSRRGDRLFPVGVKGLVAPFLSGKPVPRDVFVDGLSTRDAECVEDIAERLHIRNYRNIGVAGLFLFTTLGPAARRDTHTDILSAGGLMEATGLDPAMLVVEIREDAEQRGTRGQFAAALRRSGARLALGDFGALTSSVERYERIDPDVVSFSGDWFRKLSREAASARLFGTAVSHLRNCGVVTHLDGVETAQQLQVALDAGVDLLQGNLFRPPALAGTIFDETPLDIEMLSGRPAKVIAFPAAG